MKKIFKMLAVMVSMTAIVSSCDDSGKNGGEGEVPTHPMVGTYRLDTYKTEGEKNLPVSSPLYTVWSGNESTENMANIFRMMGGAMLPQVLGSIELKADGNLCASYVEKPVISGQDSLMKWSMGSMNPDFKFPTEAAVNALSENVGAMVSSADGLAAWSETNGVFNVKLDLAAIIGAATGSDGSAIADMIMELVKQEPAAVKGMLAAILGEKMNLISNETIKQFQSWVLNGIPMKAEEKDGKTCLYLPKTEFDSLFTMRETGEVDPDWGFPIESNDLMLVFGALMENNMIPQDMQIIGVLFQSLGGEWKNTTDFRLGLSLVKNN